MAWLWLQDRKPESERESQRGRSVCCTLQISVTQARLPNYDADWSVVVIVPTYCRNHDSCVRGAGPEDQPPISLRKKIYISCASSPLFHHSKINHLPSTCPSIQTFIPNYQKKSSSQFNHSIPSAPFASLHVKALTYANLYIYLSPPTEPSVRVVARSFIASATG